MKLSNETVMVLKNFSSINQNLVIKSGNTISTMSAMKNIVAKAIVKESFPSDFAIYDLNEFLAALSLFSKPELDFSEDFVIIREESSGSKSLKYWFSDPSVVTTPTKEIKMPSTEVSFNFSSDTLSQVQKAAAVIGAPDMALEDGKLKVTDKKNDTANAFDTDLDIVNTLGQKYQFWFKVENLKLLPGSYSVDVSSKKISFFKNNNVNIEYFIALEPESSYDE
ncbi:MAG: hypothetical protein CMO16_06650 [Thaumarchaeota archaeon]|nr:hypothetical protein [Nitrososphaerota archaeon]